jgi:hypothetical protein
MAPRPSPGKSLTSCARPRRRTRSSGTGCCWRRTWRMLARPARGPRHSVHQRHTVDQRDGLPRRRGLRQQYGIRCRPRLIRRRRSRFPYRSGHLDGYGVAPRRKPRERERETARPVPVTDGVRMCSPDCAAHGAARAGGGGAGRTSAAQLSEQALLEWAFGVGPGGAPLPGYPGASGFASTCPRLRPGTIGRIRPSCITETINLPSRSKIWPRARPRPPVAIGDSCS